MFGWTLCSLCGLGPVRWPACVLIVKPAGKLSQRQRPPCKTDATAELHTSFFLVNKLRVKERRDWWVVLNIQEQLQAEEQIRTSFQNDHQVSCGQPGLPPPQTLLDHRWPLFRQLNPWHKGPQGSYLLKYHLIEAVLVPSENCKPPSPRHSLFSSHVYFGQHLPCYLASNVMTYLCFLPPTRT